MELSKKDKKLAREIIEKGLNLEFERALSRSEQVLKEWRAQALANHEAYQKLYRHIKDYDKRIAQLYDGLRPAAYLEVIAVQYRDGFITDEDIAGLSEEARKVLQRWAAVFE